MTDTHDPATAAAVALEVEQRRQAAERTRATLEADRTGRAAGFIVAIFDGHLRDVEREARKAAAVGGGQEDAGA
jgi:hypothetical protein